MLLREDRSDPRMTRTRKSLADALESLLAEQAFDALTVQGIAARAAVNRATFYAHFTDKYGMVNDLFQERFAGMIERRVPGSANSLEDVLRGLLLAVIDHWLGTRGKCQRTYRRFETLVENQVRVYLRDWMYEWLLVQPSFRTLPHQRLAIVAGLVSGALYSAASEWIKNGEAQPAEQFADEAIPFIMAMVTTLDTK